MTDKSLIDTLAENADTAFDSWAALSPSRRADCLIAAASALDTARSELVNIAMEETGLTRVRLDAELTRTIVQLRIFADVCRAGGFLDVRIDERDTEFILGSRPDLRRYRIPLGPVLNFAASNFPFAFSVAGGDTASALAAGCPVIVKAHSGHPTLSVRTAEVVNSALVSAGAPEHTLQCVLGQQNGVDLLHHPKIRASSFTGSTSVGRTLADIAATRPEPIPFFGELGSLNPVFVTRGALARARDDIAQGLVASISGSAGQLCTKPGFVFVPVGHGLDAGIRSAVAGIDEHRLLTSSIGGGFSEGVSNALGTPGVEPIVHGHIRADGDQTWVTPTIARVGAGDFLAHLDELVHEVFGPFALLIEYDSTDSLTHLASEAFGGNLTATVHASEDEDVADLVDWMALHAGRVLFSGWPTGVAVTHAQQHGGPWPATTNDSSTSVGTAAISRFQRAVAFQDFPQSLLPEPLRDDNPWDVPQKRDPAGSSLGWGMCS